MGYEVHIERDPGRITRKEWRAAVEAEPETRIAKTKVTRATIPGIGQISMRGSDADAELRLEGDWTKVFFFKKSTGRISFRPDVGFTEGSQLHQAASALARRLDASLVGDEGEVYETKKTKAKKKTKVETGEIEATPIQLVQTYLKEKADSKGVRKWDLPKPGHYSTGRKLLRSKPDLQLDVFRIAQARLKPGLRTLQRGKLQSLCDKLLTKGLPLSSDELAKYATSRTHGQPHWGWDPLVSAVQSLDKTPTPKLRMALKKVWGMLEWNWSYKATAARIQALL
jgi:hypothetical protein